MSDLEHTKGLLWPSQNSGVKPLLFLDVDGVLNNTQTPELFVDSCLLLLKDIVVNTECEIVLSSSWRIVSSMKDCLEEKFLLVGIPKWTSETPILNSIRGLEVETWIHRNYKEGVRYAIVDDDSDFMLHQLPKLFQTDPEFGLTKTIAWRITYYLNGGHYGHRVGVSE